MSADLILDVLVEMFLSGVDVNVLIGVCVVEELIIRERIRR